MRQADLPGSWLLACRELGAVMAGGRKREQWSAARQMAESRLRQGLAAQGLHPPRQCVVCDAALEAIRDSSGFLRLVCAGACGKVSTSPVTAKALRRAGYEPLPGFE